MTAMNQVKEDYQLTTVEIFYHSYDNPQDLRSFVWQDYDMAPDYPELRRFLGYWKRHIDGVVHSVRVDGANAPKPRKAGSRAWMPSLAIH